MSWRDEMFLSGGVFEPRREALKAISSTVSAFVLGLFRGASWGVFFVIEFIAPPSVIRDAMLSDSWVISASAFDARARCLTTGVFASASTFFW